MRDFGTMISLERLSTLQAMTCPVCQNNGMKKINLSDMPTEHFYICNGCNHVLGD